jgi:ABC-type nitrate/sulfonate/bicarbonate transport system permease component
MKKFFEPFAEVSAQSRMMITLLWIVGASLLWFASSRGEKHLFPTPEQVATGFASLWNEGLVVHIAASLGLFVQAIGIAMVVSLCIAYASPIAVIKPLAVFVSKLRYLPLAGLTYYLTILAKDARTMQVSVLVIFMSTYFITSLLSVIRSIPPEEFDNASTLRCTKWETLYEIVIKGRFDVVLDVLRQNLAIIWMMLVTVESILVASGGIGVLIKNSDKFANHGRIVALQIIILLVGLGLDWCLDTFRKSAFRYATK